jgi:putative transposase
MSEDGSLSVHHVRFLSTDTLTSQLKENIHSYNTARISTKLEGLSPVQYRTQALAAGQSAFQ